ncbi:MAG: endonuclease/exonuclease/phosphatase family protein [Myxococcota bacterium]|nr:endonuclease/exonuclease/phosphatase family protein [Myxococcota bacterium]
MKRVVVAAIGLVVAGYALVTLLAFVPVFPCSMLEHFRLQSMFAGIAIVAVAHRSRWLDASLIAWIVNLALVAPDLGTSATAKQGTHVRVLFCNVHASNTDFAAVASLIADTQPDIVALVETRAPWFEKLAPVLAGYERIEHPREDNFGLGLYARGTVTGGVEHVGTDLPTIIATVTLAKGPRMSFVVTHPWPPVTSWMLDEQWNHLAALSHRVRELAAPVVFAGDLNATPWSRVFRHVMGTTELCDTRAGFGYQGSYPATSAIVRIPIDHVLVSCGVGVRDREIARDVGSDHLPVIVDLVFSPS